MTSSPAILQLTLQNLPNHHIPEDLVRKIVKDYYIRIYRRYLDIFTPVKCLSLRNETKKSSLKELYGVMGYNINLRELDYSYDSQVYNKMELTNNYVSYTKVLYQNINTGKINPYCSFHKTLYLKKHKRLDRKREEVKEFKLEISVEYIHQLKTFIWTFKSNNEYITDIENIGKKRIFMGDKVSLEFKEVKRFSYRCNPELKRFKIWAQIYKGRLFIESDYCDIIRDEDKWTYDTMGNYTKPAISGPI